MTTIVPPASDLDEAGWRELHERVASALRDRPAGLRRQLRIFLRLIQWLPLLRFGRPFTALPAGKRTRVLAWMERHRLKRIRVGFWGLRTLALMGYYGRADARREVGYRADAAGWDAWNA